MSDGRRVHAEQTREVDAAAYYIRKAAGELGALPEASRELSGWALRQARTQYYILKAQIAAEASRAGINLPRM
jgi:type IV secretory pathway TrbL component